ARRAKLARSRRPRTSGRRRQRGRARSAERALEPAEEAPVFVAWAVGVVVELLVELLDERSLLLVECGWHCDVEAHVQRATTRAAQRRHALSAEYAHLARLRARRYLEGNLTRQGLHGRRHARRGFGHRQPYRRVQVVTVSDEPLVRTHANDDEGVAALGAAESGMPLASDTDLLAVVDSPRNVDLELRPLHDTAVAAAVSTRLLEPLARTLALRARALLDELAEDVLRHASHNARARARRARTGRRPGLRPRRSAAFARDGEVERDGDGRTGERLLEVDLDDGLDVSPTLRTLPPAAEKVVSEERREDVGEVAEVRERRLEPATPESGLAVAVVRRAALRVGEHLV